MNLNLCIWIKESHQKLPLLYRVTFGEDDLLEWAKQYVSEHMADGNETIDVDVESIDT